MVSGTETLAHPIGNSPRPGTIPKLARFAVRRHWFIIGAWAVALIVLIVASSLGGGSYIDNFVLPGAPSQRAFDLLQEHFPAASGDSATLVVQAPAGLTNPAMQPRLQSLFTEASKLPEVTAILAPGQVPGHVSTDGTIAFATLQYDTRASQVEASSVEALEKLADGAAGNGLKVEVGGPVVSASERSTQDKAEAVGLVAAVLILLFTFGSFVAMGLPLISAICGLVCGLLILSLAAATMDLATITPAFVAMIGLGVGIDYALFVVTRHREGLQSGLSVEEAAATALDTSGRSVMAAGGVVVISLLGLYAIGVPFIGHLGAAAALVVILSIAVALTLLPAFLGAFGENIDKWRLPRLYAHAAATDDHNAFGYRLSQQIQRHAWWWAAGALLILIVLALPVRDLQLGFADDGYKPTVDHSRRAYDLMVKGFGPGSTAPLLITVERPEGVALATVQKLQAALQKVPGVVMVSPPQISPDKTTAILSLVPTTGSSDPETATLVHRLRDNTIPQTLAGAGTVGYVGGTTAVFVDLGDRISARMPLFFAIVIGLSFLLLMAVFRSLAIPLTAAIMNLLSVGAAYGVLVAVFQKGYGAHLLGIDKTGPIESYLPMILFAILFGLSTDYEVFLISRIRERYVVSHDNGSAVAQGLSVTTRIITAAAAIMVCVFLAFVMNEQRAIKEFGFGLAVAVLVDATVVRIILVPAVMEILGEWNWWFPTWLDRIVPRLDIEGEATPVAVGSAD